jgi:HK97 gp10 family phage protein
MAYWEKTILVKALSVEVEQAIKTLNKLGEEFDKKTRRKMLRRGAEILRDEIKSRAPRSKKQHKRYSTAKLLKNKRAPKGMGTVIQTYDPGNLKKAIVVLPLSKSHDLHVGPKVARRGQKSLPDAYYAHWLEYGAPGIGVPAHPFIRPAVASVKAKVAEAVTADAKKLLGEFEKKHSI